jgi:hypothetical protein
VTVETPAGELVAVQTHGSDTELDVGLGEEVCVWWPPERAAVINP